MSSLIRTDQAESRAAFPARHGFLGALVPPVTLAVHRSLLAAAATAIAVLALLTMIIRANPHLQIDASIERWIQAVNWGPLALTFPFFSWIGGPGGIYMQAGALLMVLLLNRRAWILALAATAGGFSYFLLVNFVHRPRPALGEVLRVTEHPGGYSFPSGHVIFITITVGLLMLCIGYRYLPRWARPIGWAVVAAIVSTAGISRIYVGAHWPTDVMASLTIAVGWLVLVTSLVWISNRALYKDAAQTQSNQRRQIVPAGDRSWLGALGNGLSSAFYPRGLLVSLAGQTAFAVLATFPLNATYLPGDLEIARWVQSASWGPLAITFPWITWLSGTGQVVVAVLLVLVVAAANLRAVPLALVGALGGALYLLLNHIIRKPRPIARLIRVTEHPGSFAFSSGHATLVLTVVGVLIRLMTSGHGSPRPLSVFLPHHPTGQLDA